MRLGIPVEEALGTLQHPQTLGPVRETDDGDIRQTYFGEKSNVTVSIRDKRVIQVNPRKKGGKTRAGNDG